MSGLDIQPQQSENDNPAWKKRFHVARNDESSLQSCTVFFVKLIWNYGSVVKASSSELRYMGSILAGYWKPLPLGHFAWHWASQCTETRAFVLLHSLYLLNFVSGNIVLTGISPLTWTSKFTVLEHVESGWFETPSQWAMVFKYFRQFKENQWPSTFVTFAQRLCNCCHHTCMQQIQACTGGHTPDWIMSYITCYIIYYIGITWNRRYIFS